MWFCRTPKSRDPSAQLFCFNWRRLIIVFGILCVIAVPCRVGAQYSQSSFRANQGSAVQASPWHNAPPQSQRGYSLQQFRPDSNQPRYSNRISVPPTRSLAPANFRAPADSRLPNGNFQYENAISAPQKGTISRFVSPFRARASQTPPLQNQPPIRYANRSLADPRGSEFHWQEERKEQAKPFAGIPVDLVPMPPETGASELGLLKPPAQNRDGSSQSSSPNQSRKAFLIPPGNAEQNPPSQLREVRGALENTQRGGAPAIEPSFEDLPTIDDSQPGYGSQPDFPPNMGSRPADSPSGVENFSTLNRGGRSSTPKQGLESAPSFDPRDGRNPLTRLANPGNGTQEVPANYGNEILMNAPEMEPFELSSESCPIDGQLGENGSRYRTEDDATKNAGNSIASHSVYGNLLKRDAPEMWWDDQVLSPQSNPDQFWKVGVNDLLAYFLENSPRARAIRLLRDSSQSAVMESHAEFDPATYVETNFTRLNDPVGNELTTGGADRFKDDNWMSRAGLRQKMRQGGTWEAYQQLGTQTNNSDFFVPTQQGNAYLSLSFTQPLLNGRGTLYNESLIAIANLEIGLADGSAAEKLQQELLSITEKYWNLYAFRAVWFQRQENVRRAEKVYQELDRRADIDVSQTQLLRARAAVATRKAALVEAYNNVRNVEVELAAQLGIDARSQIFEFVPNLKPELTFPSVDVRDAFVTALSNRPEVIQAGKKVQIAAEKANRSRHELKPILDLLVSTYVSGLNEEFEFLNAWGRQFSDGAPGYSAGLNFEMPLHRRAAKARLERDELRWKAITSDLEDEILKVQSEVDIAVRHVDISFRKLLARETAMQSAMAELQSQQERMELSLNEENLGLGLNLLLDSQDRLAEQENQLASAQSEYMISWVSLKRAMGTLVMIK